MAYPDTGSNAAAGNSLVDFRQSQGAMTQQGFSTRPVLTREDLLEIAFKLNEASVLIGQALNRMGGR